MTTELLEIIKNDIKCCEDIQYSNEGAHSLYQVLVSK